MKNTAKRLLAALLTAAILLSVPCLAYAGQTDTEPFPYIEDVELLCCYSRMEEALLRIKAAENAEKCFGRIEIWDQTENRLVGDFGDGYDPNETDVTDNRGFDCLSFDIYNPFCEESDYYIRIPADAFYEDKCSEYSVPMPEEDVIYSFSGEKFFSENFTPFFKDGFRYAYDFGYYGTPDTEVCGWIYFGKRQRGYTTVEVLVPPTWNKELTFEAKCVGKPADVIFSGTTVDAKHYNGSIVLRVFDAETGDCIDSAYIKGDSDLKNAPADFSELLLDTAAEMGYILLLPFSALFFALFGTGMGAVLGVGGLGAVIGDIIIGIGGIFNH